MTTDKRLIEDALVKYPEETIALIDSLESEHISSLLESLSWGHSCTILMSLPPSKAGRVLSKLLKATALVLLEHLPQKDASIILQQLGREKREELLEELPKEVGKNLSRIMTYAPDTIGAFVESCMVLNEGLTVKDALDQIKKDPELYGAHLYVLGKKNQLRGYLEVNRLLSVAPTDTIKLVMEDDVPSILPNFTVTEVLSQWDYRFSTLPVTDSEGTFIGTVARKGLIHQESQHQSFDKDAVQAGNALGDLYLIGLTSLFGTSSQPIGKPKK